MNRKDILMLEDPTGIARPIEEAGQILVDRTATYGHAKDQLYWQATLIHQWNSLMLREPVTPEEIAHDEAMRMIMLKMTRIARGEYHRDNYIDIIGYASIAAEMGEPPPKPEPNAPSG